MRLLPVVFFVSFQTPEAAGGFNATGARDGLVSTGATEADGGNLSSLDKLQQRESLGIISVGFEPQEEHSVSDSEKKSHRSPADIKQDGVFRREEVLFEPSASEHEVAEVVAVAARERKMRRARRAW